MQNDDGPEGEFTEFMKGGKKEEIFVPASTEFRVIIPSNEKGTGFLRNLFKKNKRFLGGLITCEEFDNCIDTAAKLTAKVYSHNRKKDVEGIPIGINLTLAFASSLILAYFFLMYFGIKQKKEGFRTLAIFLLAISVFIVIVLTVIYLFQRPDKYPPYDAMVRKTLNAYFDRLNKKHEKQGLEWFVHEDHYWIEIRINKTTADTYRQMTNYKFEDDKSEDEALKPDEDFKSDGDEAYKTN